MKILFIGEKYFALKIMNSLKNYCNKNNIKDFKFYFADTYKNILGIIKYLIYLIKSDLLISIKGYINKKNEIEFAFLFKKKIIFFWVGSDVLKALENSKRGKISKKYIEQVKHFCEVNWIKDELKKIGIEAEILNFVSIKKPNIPDISNINFEKIEAINSEKINSEIINSEIINKIYNNSTESNKDFILLTYINRYRPEFYGLLKIIDLASDLAVDLAVDLDKKLQNISSSNNIKIIITGINEYEAKSFLSKKNIYQIPENIIFKGYIKEMDKEYLNSHIFLRIIEHDGLSTSVLEALSYGKHVIYSYEFPFVYKVNNSNDLKKTVLNLYQKFKNNSLTPNYEGLKYVLSNYSEEITNKKIIDLFSNL